MQTRARIFVAMIALAGLHALADAHSAPAATSDNPTATKTAQQAANFAANEQQMTNALTATPPDKPAAVKQEPATACLDGCCRVGPSCFSVSTMDTSDSTWVLLQLFVAGCAGLLMWGFLRIASNVWNWCFPAQRVRVEPRKRIRGEWRDHR